MNQAEIRALVNSIKTIPNNRLDEIAKSLEDTENTEEKWLVKSIGVELGRRALADKILAQKEGNGHKAMTPQEELYSKLYFHQKILVKDMDIVQLQEHHDELAKIAFEAKVRHIATNDELRERKAKAGAGKEWLVSTDNGQVSSDAINAVKVRAARMSKMDKLRNQLLAAGIEEATVNEMVSNLQRKATEKNVKTITFNKPSIEVDSVNVVTTKPESKPFDPSTLKFG